MAQIGTGWSAVVPYTLPFTVYSASLQGGAAVVWDGTNKGVAAPGGAEVTGFAGFITNQQPSTGTTSGDRVDIQNAGIAIGLLKAGETVTYGQRLVIAGTDGSLKAYDDAGDDNLSIVGIALASFTAGSQNDTIPVSVQQWEINKS
jgi:hypothetical protein